MGPLQGRQGSRLLALPRLWHAGAFREREPCTHNIASRRQLGTLHSHPTNTKQTTKNSITDFARYIARFRAKVRLCYVAKLNVAIIMYFHFTKYAFPQSIRPLSGVPRKQTKNNCRWIRDSARPTIRREKIETARESLNHFSAANVRERRRKLHSYNSVTFSNIHCFHVAHTESERES